MENQRFVPEYPSKSTLSHERKIVEEKVIKNLERKERPHLDDDDARQSEPWQYFWIFNFFR